MGRLSKWGGDRQRELFDRKDLPALIPTLRYYEEASRRKEARSSPPRYAWQGAGAWCRQIGRLAAIETCSNDWSSRFSQAARELTVERIRESRQLEDLERIAGWLDEARRERADHELARVWSRSELGELRVEARNRIALLRMGRDRPKEKGDRFDVSRIPIERLEALIQQHPKLELVEQLRAERNRRAPSLKLG